MSTSAPPLSGPASRLHYPHMIERMRGEAQTRSNKEEW